MGQIVCARKVNVRRVGGERRGDQRGSSFLRLSGERLAQRADDGRDVVVVPRERLPGLVPVELR